LNYPFPEIYIASSEMDVEKLKALEIVVDGQQRLNAIVDYIKGINDFKTQKKLTPFDELPIEEKKEFLNYSVTVKDMKDIGMDNIKEIFKRINSTDYSLNANEVINAKFGDGEFAIFCKQLADGDYEVTVDETDVIVNPDSRFLVNDFFSNNNVFSDNDIKRMFDSQYLMLIVSTILEGSYYGRSTRINYYLEKYNFEFGNYEILLNRIINSINIIKKLKLTKGSYWFNKANLFTLIIELKDVKETEINLNQLELKLIDMENKVDLYFNGDEDEIKLLTSDETKYFEVARQGSHELAAREHRGKVIKEIILSSIITSNNSIPQNSILDKNLGMFKENGISFSILIPTTTGLSKSIMDATSNVREFLKQNNIHDYSIQEFGPTNKFKISSEFVQQDFTTKSTEASLYRSNGRGDYRIWFSDLKEFADANDNLGLIVNGKMLTVLNISKHDYSGFIAGLKKEEN
jgi:hypothetical protein